MKQKQTACAGSGMLDTTTNFRPRHARPSPLPLYLYFAWRTDVAVPVTLGDGALLAKARAGRLKALVTSRSGRKRIALPPVTQLYVSTSFDKWMEGNDAMQAVSASIAAE